MVTQKLVLFSMIGVVVLASGILLIGAAIGHTGLFQFGAETAKYIFGAVIGALASAFSTRGTAA
jgi:hypothetical protein